MIVPMNDLGAEYASLRDEIDAAINSVLTSGRFVLESQLADFEAEFADFIGVKHAIGVGSGTDALRIALEACDLEPGDEVVTAPNTDNPTASAIVLSGARVTFADVDASSFNISPEGVQAALTERTRAILPVHLFGYPAPMDQILAIASEHDLIVIEDSALAVGAKYKGRRTGSFGLIGCFSLAPSKILGGLGDGGMVVTDDDDIAERAQILRNYGHSPGTSLDPADPLGGGTWRVLEHGFNSRLDSIQAAVLRVKLRTLEERIKARRDAAATYKQLLANAPVTTPDEEDGIEATFFAYNILAQNRDELRRDLADQGVATRLYYNPPLHLQPAFASLGYAKGSFPVAERVSRHILGLPIFPQMTADQIKTAAEAVINAARQE